jgi:hypothetical protein
MRQPGPPTRVCPNPLLTDRTVDIKRQLMGVSAECPLCADFVAKVGCNRWFNRSSRALVQPRLKSRLGDLHKTVATQVRAKVR